MRRCRAARAVVDLDGQSVTRNGEAGSSDRRTSPPVAPRGDRGDAVLDADHHADRAEVAVDPSNIARRSLAGLGQQRW
jgi:hypothetical protein